MPDRIVSYAAVLPRLSHLKFTTDLEINVVTDELLVHLRDMPSLTTLHLRHVDSRKGLGSGLAHLIPAAPKVCSLQKLDLLYAHLQPKTLQYIFRMPRLTSLSINLSSISTSNMLSVLPRFKELSALRELNVLTDDDEAFLPDGVFRGLPLTRLLLINFALAGEGMSSLTSLKELAIENCTQLNDEDNDTSLSFLNQLPEGLQDLSLERCKTLSDDNLTHLPTTLQSFGLNECDKITEIGLAAVAQRCPEVHYVCIVECSETVASGLAKFTAARTLIAEDCFVNDRDLLSISEAVSQLETLWLTGEEVDVDGKTLIDCFGQKSTTVKMHEGQSILLCSTVCYHSCSVFFSRQNVVWRR